MLHLNIIKVKTPEEMGKAAADEPEAPDARDDSNPLLPDR